MMLRENIESPERHAVQDPSKNEQKQNQGNGKRIILKYAHGAPPIHRSCDSVGFANPSGARA